MDASGAIYELPLVASTFMRKFGSNCNHRIDTDTDNDTGQATEGNARQGTQGKAG